MALATKAVRSFRGEYLIRGENDPRRKDEQWPQKGEDMRRGTADANGRDEGQATRLPSHASRLLSPKNGKSTAA